MSSIADDIVAAIEAMAQPSRPIKIERYEKIINDDGTVTFHIFAREESAIKEADVTITVNP